MKQPIRLGIIGFGTVGTGVARIILDNARLLEARAGGALEIARVVVNDVAKERQVQLDPAIITTDPYDVINDPDIPIVVEVVGCPGGSTEPARTWLIDALRRGKHVVTANKDVVAHHLPQLLQTAEQHGGSLYFEAAVAGGIPIIKPLKECLVGNRVQSIMGIINGTTNYMLTKMTRDGASFADVLQEAQQLGYAESDPTSDVGGHDAAYKLAILASLAFETNVPIEAVYREGITNITTDDIRHATELGYAVKLLAIGKRVDGGIQVRVHPAFVPQAHPLASVNDVFNAVFVSGDAVGDLMFYGRGAGMMPTGSAVVADIVEAAINTTQGCAGRAFVARIDKRMVSIAETVSRFYVNIKVVDRPGVLAAITTIFGEEGVSLESVIQKGRGQDPVSLVFITHDVREENIRIALRRIEQLSDVRVVSNVIRVEGDANARDH